MASTSTYTAQIGQYTAQIGMDEAAPLMGRLPPIQSPSPLLHPNTKQIDSFHPQNLGRRDARRRSWASGQRLRALSTVSGIMNDVGYYRHFTSASEEEPAPPKEEPDAEAEEPHAYTRSKTVMSGRMDDEQRRPETEQRRRARSLPPGSLDLRNLQDSLPWKKKLADGWSYDKYKSALNSKGTMLNWSAPSAQKMDQFIRRKQDTENAYGIAVKCSNSPRLYSVVRRVLMGWQMKGELDRIILWVANMVRYEFVVKRLKQHMDRCRPLFACLRVIAQWGANLKAAEIEEAARLEQERKAEAAKYVDFARGFLLAVDDDDDGGLSLCELKAAEMGSLGAVNPMYSKASIWLMNNRNFQKYDVRNIGIVDEEQLVDAMRVFLEDHWKFDGVLW